MLYQLKKYAIVVLLLLCLVSCKKQYVCSYAYIYIPEQIAFAGYTAGELSQVVFQRYKAGDNFSELISSDTIDASGAAFKGDTAYLAFNASIYRGFFSVREGIDYKVSVLQVNKDYAIVLKGGKSGERWTQQEECSPGASDSRPVPYFITVNGEAYQAFSPYPNNFFICLQR